MLCCAFSFLHTSYHTKVPGTRVYTCIDFTKKHAQLSSAQLAQKRSAVLCHAVRCGAVPCRAVLCFLFRTYQVSYESTTYQGMYVHRVTAKKLTQLAQLAQLAQQRRAVPCPVVRCGAVTCCTVPCCVLSFVHTVVPGTNPIYVCTYI